MTHTGLRSVVTACCKFGVARRDTRLNAVEQVVNGTSRQCSAVTGLKGLESCGEPVQWWQHNEGIVRVLSMVVADCGNWW